MKDPEQMTMVCSALRIHATSKWTGKIPEGWPADTRAWKTTLHMGKRRLTVAFHQGSGHREDPTAADVIGCLVSDVPSGEMSFEDFCSSFGSDPDSRKAERTWKACKRLAPKVRQFLGEHFDRVANAEH